MTTVPHDQTAGNRLVILAPNWLGDAVMALPAIADVRRSGRHSVIEVAAKPSIAPLFACVEGIDGVIDVSSMDLAARGFDAALLLPNSFRSALVVRNANIPERWGYRTQGRSLLLTQGVGVGARGHQAAYYQHLVRELGYESGPPEPRLDVTDAMRADGADCLARAGWDRAATLVAFAPGAANGRAKQWPSDSYARVAEALAEDRIHTVLLGTKGDVGVGDEVVSAISADARPRIINLIGDTDLLTLAGVLVHCRSLVCNDSGAMHLAAALGVAVTAMFGPSNDRETFPLGRGRSTVLTNDVWCRPCMLRDCPLDHRCMTGIAATSVVSATRDALRARPTA